MNPPEKTSIEFKIIVSDFVMDNVQNNEEFEVDIIVEKYKFDYEKHKHLVSYNDDHNRDSAKLNNTYDPTKARHKTFKYIVDFMLKEGYIYALRENDKKAIEETEYYPYKLTEKGIQVKTIGSHKEYQKLNRKYQLALLKVPSFNYMTRWFAFGLTLIGMTITYFISYKGMTNLRYDLTKKNDSLTKQIQSIEPKINTLLIRVDSLEQIHHK